MRSEIISRLIPVLVGVIASVSALWTATALRARACADAGARWDAAARACLAVDGTPAAVSNARPYAIAALVGLALLVVLWRTYTFVIARGARRVHDASGDVRGG